VVYAAIAVSATAVVAAGIAVGRFLQQRRRRMDQDRRLLEAPATNLGFF
jgi:hypothetical protein